MTDMVALVVSDVLGVNAILGLALTIAWVVVLAINLFRYNQQTRSVQRFYLTESIGGFWIAFSLLQVSSILTGIVEKGVVTLAVGFFCGGVFVGVKWWQLRTTGKAASG